MNGLKPPTSLQEQISILEQRGLVISDKEQAREKLSSFNYYTLTGYLHDFRKPDSENYIEGLTFEKIFQIIEFDRRFRNVLLYAIETIEHRLKTKIAFYHARAYGADAYLDATNFRDQGKHAKFLDFFRRAVNREPKPPFVKHHETKYGGIFPIWVGVELFTMGMLYHFYQNLPGIDQKAIARMYNTGPRQLESWIECVTYLRNMIAHYMRIYNFKTQKTPIRCNKNHEYKNTNHFVFDIVSHIPHP